MKTKSAILMISLLTVVGIGIGFAAVAASKRKLQQSKREERPVKNQVTWYAEKAKANGSSKVTLPVPPIEYGGSSFETDTDAALSYYSVVIAQPVTERVTVDETGNSIVTWYKFKVIETLHEKVSPACPGCIPTPPEDLMPVDSDEFLASKLGGQIVVNGVTVSMDDPAFPQLKMGHHYLLYISRYPNGVADIGAGPNGVFTVDNEGKVEPINNDPHPLKKELRDRFGKSLVNLRLHIKAMH